MKYQVFTMLFAPTWLLTALYAPLLGQDAIDALTRQYYVEVQFFSLIPGGGIDSYRSHGGGGAGGHNATLGLFANDERLLTLTVETQFRSKEFVATVRTERKNSDGQRETLEREVVLSDLQPQTIEVANDDGRVYQVLLVPQVRDVPQPREFDVNRLKLDHWVFSSSPMILNDQDYIGRLGMSSGPFAFVDLPGLAKIEFSLLPFRGAKPLGSLENGVIHIAHESGTSLRISDVANGIHREVLKGGPYQVFVRWSEPSMSVAEYRQALEGNIAIVKEQIESGDLSGGSALLQHLERARSSDRVMMMTSGLGPIPIEDRIQAE